MRLGFDLRAASWGFSSKPLDVEHFSFKRLKVLSNCPLFAFQTTTLITAEKECKKDHIEVNILLICGVGLTIF